MRQVYRLQIIILLGIILSACQMGFGSKENNYSYPPTLEREVQSSGNQEPYPHVYPTFEPYPFKTSIPNTVTIHGKLVIFQPEIARPVEDGLFLVAISKEDAYDLSVPFFDAESTPQAEFDERTGEFYFTNIEPGFYMLAVLTTGTAQVPVLQLDNDIKIIIEVTNKDRNQVIELGYVRLP